MKRLILISAIFTAAFSSFGQECCKNNAIYKFDHASSPKTIRALGTNPEFVFISNQQSPDQVYSIIKKCSENNTQAKGMGELNNMLIDLGYQNGVKDLNEGSITAAVLPSGTEGNMGSGGYTADYIRLSNEKGFKAWKIASPNGADKSLYILARCGNAFVPKTSCKTIPVNFTGDAKEVTLTGGACTVGSDNQYIYYTKKQKCGCKVKKQTCGAPATKVVLKYNGTEDDNFSCPLLVSSCKRVDQHPETYKVSIANPEDRVKVCNDQRSIEVTANLNVEKISSYSGYNPAVRKNFHEVTRREYRRVDRRLRKIQRHEDKIADITCIQVKCPTK